MRERLKHIAFFTKLWWYALWGWAAYDELSFCGHAVPDEFGDGVNVPKIARIKVLYIETTTEHYLIKRLLYKIKEKIK